MENTENIRKYRKKIDKNGWMARVYRYVTGREPNFVGYCPFFWAVWLCLLLSPFALIGRMFEFLIPIFVDFFKSPKPQPYSEVERGPYRPSDFVLYNFYVHYIEHNKDLKNDLIQDYYRPVVDWIAITPNWESFCIAVYEMEKEKERLQELRREKSAKNKENVDKIVSYLKYGVKPLLFLAAAGLAYFAYELIYILIASITFPDFLWFAKMLGVGIVGALSFFLTVFGLTYVWCVLKAKFKAVPISTVRKPSILTHFLVGIVTAFEFVIETIRMTYKKECPLIEWGDETTPIHRAQQSKQNDEN